MPCYINPNVGRAFTPKALWFNPVRDIVRLNVARPFRAQLTAGEVSQEDIYLVCLAPNEARGILYRLNVGTPVFAPASGKVVKAGDGGLAAGMTVWIHQTSAALFGAPVRAVHSLDHLSLLGEGIRPGAQVRAGQVIGYSGRSGFTLGAQGQKVQLEPGLEWTVRLFEPSDPALAEKFRNVVTAYNHLKAPLDHPRILSVMAYWLSSGDYDGVEAYLLSVGRRGMSEWDWGVEQGTGLPGLMARVERLYPDLGKGGSSLPLIVGGVAAGLVLVGGGIWAIKRA